MVLYAVALAIAVRPTVGNALIVPLLADEERQSQGVFGHVGPEAVSADAAVRQGGLYFDVRILPLSRSRCTKTHRVTGVYQGLWGAGLFANERAGAQLAGAPVLPRGQGNAVWVDIVVGAHEHGGSQSH